MQASENQGRSYKRHIRVSTAVTIYIRQVAFLLVLKSFFGCMKIFLIRTSCTHYGYCSLFFEAQREHYFGLDIICIHVCGWKRMAVFWFSNHLICFLLDSLIWNGTLQYIALARKCRKERLWHPFLIKGTRPEPKSQFSIKVETPWNYLSQSSPSL